VRSVGIVSNISYTVTVRYRSEIWPRLLVTVAVKQGRLLIWYGYVILRRQYTSVSSSRLRLKPDRRMYGETCASESQKNMSFC